MLFKEILIKELLRTETAQRLCALTPLALCRKRRHHRQVSKNCTKSLPRKLTAQINNTPHEATAQSNQTPHKATAQSSHKDTTVTL